MTTNKCPLRTKSAKESRPWGVTAWGAGASYKLHGGGMIMCKETKEKTNSWILQYVGDRRINTLCWISKGISLFSVLSLLFFPRLLKIILDGWNVSGIHSTLQMGRLESRSDDYCLAHPGVFFFCPFLCVFFFCFNHFTITLTTKTLNKTGTQQQSILKIALVLPGFFCFFVFFFSTFLP